MVTMATGCKYVSFSVAFATTQSLMSLNQKLLSTRLSITTKNILFMKFARSKPKHDDANSI